VLDEPFSGLDPIAMDSMSPLLIDIAQAGGAVLFSSHQLDVVEHLCEDVVVIDSGYIVLAGELDEIRDRAPDRYLDITVADDPERLLHLTKATVVAHDGNRIRLQVPRTLDLAALLPDVGAEVVRLAYEPPTLSELFRRAVARAPSSLPEVSGVVV
jgi:ABC-2 type transport system ATP-binding protein